MTICNQEKRYFKDVVYSQLADYQIKRLNKMYEDFVRENEERETNASRETGSECAADISYEIPAFEYHLP